MDEEVHDLLLGPFRELVEKSQAAIKVAQAADHTDMLEASQALAKKGERALKTIEPIANRQLATYGTNFVEALKDHDGIAEHVDSLNEILYDFEDFAEPDTFDADRFKDVGERTQKATLRIGPILKRMKLELPSAPSFSPASPFVNPSTSRVDSMSTISTIGNAMARSPRLDPLAQPEDLPHGQRQSLVVQRTETVLHVEDDETRDEGLPVMGKQGGPDLGYNDGAYSTSPPLTRTASKRSTASVAPPSPVPENPPAEPNTNPWQLGARPPIDTIPEGEEDSTAGGAGTLGPIGSITDNDRLDVTGRRRRVSTRPDSPTLPPLESQEAEGSGSRQRAVSMCSIAGPSQFATRRLDDGVDAWQQRAGEEEHRRQSYAASQSYALSALPESQPDSLPVSSAIRSSPRMSVVSANWALPSQEQQVAYKQQATLGGETVDLPMNIHASHTSTSTQGTGCTPTSSGANTHSRGSLVVVSPTTPGGGPAPQLLSNFGSAYHPDSTPIVAHSPDREATSALPAVPDESAGLQVVDPPTEYDEGLIVVESQFNIPKGPTNEELIAKRAGNCNIGPNSSFHLLKGFCPGAREVIQGGKGVHKVQKMAFSGGGNYAAKCVSCFYELQWSEVERDRLNEASTNYRMHGIGFRLRFLSKSHLPCRSVVDPAYACLFCLQEGRTVEESDATVFFSQSQLFSHLARHPRPLPYVPGVVVVEGPERPLDVRNNYDLHFTLPPVRSQLDGIRRELDQLPVGTAVDTFRRTHGSLRRPFDDVVPLQFPEGAKIVGIEFPVKYKGEWGVGWFDNMRAPFPAEMVRLDPPPRNEIRAQGTSALRATTRWRWGNASQYKNSEWLRFDKNETINNIIYANPEHWCWAGTNSRGKWGYFPQSHIVPNSLRETTTASDKASIVSERTGGRLLSRFRSTAYSSNSSGGGSNMTNSSSGVSTSRGLRRVSINSTSTSSSH